MSWRHAGVNCTPVTMTSAELPMSRKEKDDPWGIPERGTFLPPHSPSLPPMASAKRQTNPDTNSTTYTAWDLRQVT